MSDDVRHRSTEKVYDLAVFIGRFQPFHHGHLHVLRRALERASFERIIRKTHANGGRIVSVVSDTWNIFRAANYWSDLAPLIKELGMTLVVRPDSGDPDKVLPDVIRRLGDGFGFTTNSKGFHVLNGVKVLWGDGIDETTHLEPLQIARRMKVSAQSVFTGSGGGLMQAKINRDTCKFAFKASAIETDDGWQGIAKDPVTDPGKQSKRGRLKLVRTFGRSGYQTVGENECEGALDMLQTVYKNGRLFNETTLDEVRKRVDSQLEAA